MMTKALSSPCVQASMTNVRSQWLVTTVIVFNRLVWDRLYRAVHERYRLEG